MLHHVIYVVLVLLHQLADCKPVENKEETLENLYKIIKNETCSLDISSSVDDNKFIELCGDKSLPKLKYISDDRFLFNFQDYLCYSVYHNVKALCDPGHKQSTFTPQPFVSEPDKFCSSIPDVNITEQCNTWLEGGAGEMGTEDCNLVSKVIATIMKNSTLCSNECIKADKLDPMCQSLVGTSLILAAVNNVSVKNSPEETLPPSPREIIEKKTDQSESTKKSEEAVVENTDKVTQPKVPDNETVTTVKEERQETIAGKPEAQALRDDNQDKNKNEKVTEGKEEKKEDVQEKNEKISSVAEGKEKQKEEEEEDYEEEEDEDNQDMSGDGEKHSKTEKNEGEDEAGDEIEPKTTDLVTGEVTKTTEEKKEEPSPAAPPLKDKTEEVNQDFQGSIKAGNDIGDESHFFSYFMMLSVVAIVAYLVFHNKRQIMALLLEGRRQQGGRRRSGGREYRKLDSNAEEREMIY